MASMHSHGMAEAIQFCRAAFAGVRQLRGHDRRQRACSDAAAHRLQLQSIAASEPLIRTGPVLLAPPQAKQNVGKGFAGTAATPVAWRKNDTVVYWGFALFGIKAEWRRSRRVLTVVQVSPLCVTDGSQMRRVKPCDLRYLCGDDDIDE